MHENWTRKCDVGRSVLLLFAALPLLAAGSSGQSVTPIEVALTPELPAWRTPAMGGTPLTVPDLRFFELNLGDLDGNGVQDLVYSNGLAFCRVYFMDCVDCSTTPQYSVIGHYDVLDWATTLTPPCSTSGAGAVGLTITTSDQDSALVYDIDLDGRDELIYFEHVESPSSVGGVSLRVYHFDAARNLEDLGAGAHALTSDLQLLSDPGGGDETPFFAEACMGQGAERDVSRTLSMRIGNVRGRTFPQDIIIWSNLSRGSKSVAVYGYDTDVAGGEDVSLLFEHSTESDPNDDWLTAHPEWQGDPGHNWRARDIDYDGKDELVGKHLVSFDPDAPPNMGKTVEWGMGFKNVDHEGSTSIEQNTHPDHAVALDFLDSYIDPRDSTKRIPSPGYEIVVSAQSDEGTIDPDLSGPWIYRAITGHDFSSPPMPLIDSYRYWPLRTLSIAPAGAPEDGEAYSWPSMSTGYQQPHPTSNWDDYLNDVPPIGSGSMSIDIKEPGSQRIIPGRYISGLDGPQLFVTSKGATDHGTPCGNIQQSQYMMDGTENLTILGWTNDAMESVQPSSIRVHSIDFEGTRETIELQSISHVECLTANPGDPDAGHAVFKWIPSSDPHSLGWEYEPSRVNLYPHPTGANYVPPVGASQQIRDVIGDSREEHLVTRVTDLDPPGTPPHVFETSTLLIIGDDSAAPTRPPESPVEYLHYRTRPKTDYSDYVDYESLTGFKLIPGFAPRGTVNVPFGFEQDPELIPEVPAGSGSRRALAITAEGGVTGYTIVLDNPSELQDGLSVQTVSHARLGDIVCIYGTPTEAASRKLSFTVTEGGGGMCPKQETLSLWLTVDPASPGAATTDKAPYIYRGGFNGVHLPANSMVTNVVANAWVEDIDDDVVSVDVLDELGGIFASLTKSTNPLTPDKWSARLTLDTKASGQYALLTMVATDALGHKSPIWPRMTIQGGDGGGPVTSAQQDWLPFSSEDKTPRIRWVDMPRHTIVPAEISDAGGIQSINVKMMPYNGTITEIEVRVLHPLVQNQATYQLVFPNPVTAGPNLYRLEFDTSDFQPAGQFGWGEYNIDIRVKGIDAMGDTRYSDWWPRLVAH